jgi:excisionase family DNA binding protein
VLGDGRSTPFNGGRKAMTKLSEYVKVAEAARILGISQNTVRTWAEARKIPMRRNPANGYRLFRRSDLVTFLDKLERSTQ